MFPQMSPGQVGAFPGIRDIVRRMVRAPTNPMDVSTVVSIYPREIVDTKCTLQPSTYIVPAGTIERPGILKVTPASWWKEIDENQPILEIPVYSVQVAESIVQDYCRSLLGATPNAMPGIFYVPGEFDAVSIKLKYSSALKTAEEKQRRWYLALVELADVMWSRTNGNPISISDLQRMAARELTMTNKDWLKNYQMVDMVRCFACGSLRNPEFPVCAACKVIDPNHPKAKDLKFAQ
jgi:hypothetical protein